MSLEVLVGRIETLALDAIVNPANAALLPGGGADGAIRRAAGPELDALLASKGGLAEGAALATPGFKLPARFIVHTVAPIWFAEGDEAEKIALLRNCYVNSLRVGAEIGAASIAFPAIGTGAFGWPKRLACDIALGAAQAAQAPARIVFCCFSEEDSAIYREILR